MKNNNNNNINNNDYNIRGGPTRFDPRGVTLRRAGLNGQARNTFGSFPPWVHPIPASRPMPSGLYMCMALPPTEKIPDRRLGWKLWRASLGDVGGPNRPHPDPFGSARAALAARAPKRRSKRFGGTGRRRAENVTHSVFWRTCVRQVVQFIT